MVLNLFKYWIKKIIYAVNDTTFYPGVEFYNSKSTLIFKPISIGKGSRLHVIQTTGDYKNIIIGKNCWIGRDVEIQSIFDSQIVLKSNVSIQDRCKIIGDVVINQDTLLAPDVILSSGSHFYNYIPELLIKIQDKLLVRTKEDFHGISKKINIEEDCWIGKSVIVKSGVIISRGAIVGANSFVNKNIPPYEIWAGNPAKFVKSRLIFNPKYELMSTNIKDYPYFYLGFNHHDTSNGFMSNDLSICILGKVDLMDLISLELEIINSGELSIYIDDFEVYHKKLEVGKVKLQNLQTNNIENKFKICSSLNYLKSVFLNNSIIRFEFISSDKVEIHNFKLFEIKVNRSEENS
jgi:acetyltransferase-like isoleucine patch superfamily enzyme